MLKKYDVVIYKNSEGSGARIQESENGQFFKAEDVLKYLEEFNSVDEALEKLMAS
jgi:hypothetical protein